MKITHTRPGARGRLHGVDFVDGIGYTDDPAVAERLRNAGHAVEHEPPAEPEVEVPDEPPVDIED